MFKKAFENWKTTTNIRTSDRKKLKQRVASEFAISLEDADQLVPDGLATVKFVSHKGIPGVVYLAPDGDPLWFTLGRLTLGKGSEDLIPTVYALWQKNDLIPVISTPSPVIAALVNGADLMIPGVISCPPGLQEGQLVAICKYELIGNVPTLSSPLSVGRMAISSDQLRDQAEKGKAVNVLHTWKDYLWDIGSKIEVPKGQTEQANQETNEGEANNSNDSPDVPPSEDAPKYSTEEVSQLLYMSLVQAISTTLRSLPSSAFPIPSTIFYTSYILPSRPYYPELLLRPMSAPADYRPSSNAPGPDPYSVTIKTSSHKSLSVMLKAADKTALITTKSPQKHSAQTDILIVSVNTAHPDVDSQAPFVTIGAVEEKASKKAAREEKAKEEETAAKGLIGIKELLKPHMSSVSLFETMGASPAALYTSADVRAIINTYIASEQLVNAERPLFVNLNHALQNCIASDDKEMKRDELAKCVVKKMQAWHELNIPGEESETKKGNPTPIQVVLKTRRGNKAVTLVTGFELFHIDADDMAEELRKACAGSTSVSPIPGRPANSGVEVMVQGKQANAAIQYLVGKGVPKKWIEQRDLTGKKKKKL